MQLQVIEDKIYEVRGHHVMLDFDLAELYKVETRALKQAVRRNLDRFPSDFMFQLTKTEWQKLITNCDNLRNTIKYSPSTPFAFTEEGVAMLSGVLKSKQAVQLNIAIMRTFVLLRQQALSHKDITEQLKKLERKYNKKFTDIETALTYLLQKDQQETEQKERKRIGYKT